MNQKTIRERIKKHDWRWDLRPSKKWLIKKNKEDCVEHVEKFIKKMNV